MRGQSGRNSCRLCEVPEMMTRAALKLCLCYVPSTEMVKAIKGCLIKTEPSIREIILKIGEDENFVIEDINDEMLFVDPRCKSTLKEKVDKILSSVTKRTEGSGG